METQKWKFLKTKPVLISIRSFVSDKEFKKLLKAFSLIDKEVEELEQLCVSTFSQKAVFLASKSKNKNFFKLNLGRSCSLLAKYWFIFSLSTNLDPEKTQLPQKFFSDGNFATFLSSTENKILICRKELIPNHIEDEEPQKGTIFHNAIQEMNARYGHEGDVQFFLRKHQMLQARFKNDLEKPASFQYINCILEGMRFFSIILFEAGNFTVAFFEKFKEIFHESEHKYVIRKKGGVQQSKKDSKAAIHSIGSQIRRENEKVFNENIQKIVEEQKTLFLKCKTIFCYAPGLNFNVLKNYLTSIEVDEDKMRSLNFRVEKAKYQNIDAIFQKLTRFYFFN